MTKKAMVFDRDRCVGCNACVVACQQNYSMPPENKLNWVNVEVEGEFPNVSIEFVPQLCAHCNNPVCLEVCPVEGATFKTEEGYVLVNEDLCIGCTACVKKCPYGARSMNQDNNKAVKCTFCSDIVEHGGVPVCVNTCPTKCRIFGDLDEADSQVSQLVAGGELTRYDELIGNEDEGLYPNVYYK